MSVGRLVVFIAVALLGLAMVGSGANMLLQERADVEQAVSVEGTIETTDVKDASGIISTANRPETSDWKAVIRYTYIYEGQEYTSESVYPGFEKSFKFEENARSVANRVSAGETVTVYVNQRRPSRAFLIEETGGNLGPYFLFGIGALLAVPFLMAIRKELFGSGSGS